MRVSGSERPNPPPSGGPDDQRVPLRRSVLWGLIALAVVVGIYLYFQYERVLAPLISS